MDSDFAEWRETRKIILAVEAADVLDEALLGLP
jgi:hypothetical protein